MSFLSLAPERLAAAYQTALSALVAERLPEGYWTGELSVSALSTATAISALALIQKHSTSSTRYDGLIAGGLTWLAEHQNQDGGWGDTVKSRSNISTTMLCRAALHVTEAVDRYAEVLRRTDEYIAHYGTTAQEQSEAVRARYGKDRTFAVPILTTCALAGLVAWEEVPSLPFELACCPQSWFRFLKLPVVSYALPALIAIGQAVYHHRPPRNPLARQVRCLAVEKSLHVLETIQPSNGGFLEATPLTSFVTLSLASIGQADHLVARRGVEFLVRSARPNGGWPIDTNLATWVTTLSLNALAAAGDLETLAKPFAVQEWLLKQQFRVRHPYTDADPGGWGWTDLPGSVPDADDTAGALVALGNLSKLPALRDETSPRMWIRAGIRWLLDLQNRDGGWPTFCRGWGNLPFDRSGCDLTAHVLRALTVHRSLIAGSWRPWWQLREGIDSWASKGDISLPRLDRALERGCRYLEQQQRTDGSWLPLWFGNQHSPDDENPTYGTARVLVACRDLDKMGTEPARRGVAWLLAAQNADGGWGGTPGTPSTLEETALTVEALLDADHPHVESAVNGGLSWLVQQVETGGLGNPAPIGFYFAKLWYFEKLYPIIFTVAALGRAYRKYSRRHLCNRRSSTP